MVLKFANGCVVVVVVYACLHFRWLWQIVALAVDMNPLGYPDDGDEHIRSQSRR